jgi:hypothetical protein
MTKCLVCKINLPERYREEICSTCFSFFLWKYADNFPEKLDEIRELYKNQGSTSTKCYRRKK